MTENEIASRIVQCSYDIHTKLGPGLLESVYEVVLANALSRGGLKVARQVPIPIRFEYFSFDEGFKADLIVADKVIVELKATEEDHPVYRKQVITYLKFTNLRLGLLVNFGAPLIKNGITRLVNELPEKKVPLFCEPKHPVRP